MDRACDAIQRLVASWKAGHAQVWMKFTVPKLKELAKAESSLNGAARVRLSAMLHRRQPELCELLDDVGLDPRCLSAHQFCTSICALALRHAEEEIRHRLPSYPTATIHELAGQIRRGEERRIGQRACGFRERIRRYVLINRQFDEDDTDWLCTMISTFFFLIERSHRTN
jgi:hypothetical protein